MAASGSGLKLQVNAFNNEGDIPSKFTCEGANVSPGMAWSGVPEGTKSLALIVDDPDAPDPAKPEKVFTHWVIYNIPPTLTKLGEGEHSFPRGTQHGSNDFSKTDYSGPCPPIGKHRYFFKLYALDTNFHFMVRPSRADLEKEMANHILGQSEVIGLYAKKNH
jgi:Raf kinase inhibitor-like YbhB/YbcL family protein